MKLAEVDWADVLAALPLWEALSPAARKAFVTIKPGQGAEAFALGPAVHELVASGFVTPPGPKGRLYTHAPPLRPLLVALRAMDRLRPLDGPHGTLSDSYVQDQMTLEEAGALIGNVRSPYYYGNWVDRGEVVSTVSSIDWLNGFLAAVPGTPLLEWEQAHLSRGQHPILVSPAAGQAMRRVLEVLGEHPEGVPLSSFHALVPDVDPKHRIAVLRAGLRYLLFFVSMRGEDDLQPVIGLLPAVIRRMGPPPEPPVAVPVITSFEAPFLISDMTAVLVEAAGEPLSVRGDDGRLYVRAQRALAARLVRPPAWADPLLFDVGKGKDAAADEDAVVEDRLTMAVEVLTSLEFAIVHSRNGKWLLIATHAGRAWLALAEGERLRRVLDAYRASPQRSPDAWNRARGTADFLGMHPSFPVKDDKVDLRAALAAAFLTVPAGAVIPAGAFLRHHAELHNPLLSPAAAKLRSRGGYGTPRNREGWETVWAAMLEEFLRLRLVPLGGARLGVTADGHVAFGLTDAGRYLLGATDDFSFAPQADGEVLVQPDFEIVFLSPAPRIEAELARFAERTGKGAVGALFRITRASVLRAAETGISSAQMLKSLGEMSRAPVPANVARQVKDWFGGTRRVRVQPTVLVECPDSETAARVAAIGGAEVSQVTRTLLRLDGDQKRVDALVKKLRAKGIFVDA